MKVMELKDCNTFFEKNISNMRTNHAFMAQELPEEEMKMLYSLLGKTPPKTKSPQPRFRLNFRFSKRAAEEEKF